MLKKITFRFALLAALLLGTVSVYGQSANLIEAGKKEGKVVIYGSLESDSGKQFSMYSRRKPASTWTTGARRRPKSWTVH